MTLLTVVRVMVATAVLALAWEFPPLPPTYLSMGPPNKEACTSSLKVDNLLATVTLGNYPHERAVIQQTLNLYAFIIDYQAWDRLERVLHPDIWADYTGYIGVVQGISQVTAGLQRAMARVTSQHALSTQIIDIASGGETAHSLTHYWATHWGTGEYYGQVRRACYTPSE
jgi:hypothetical protein